MFEKIRFVRAIIVLNQRGLVLRFMKLLLSILLITNICFGQSTIIWKVTDAINNKTSFIVGTFHNIGNSFVDSIPVIKTALLQSEVAIFESIDDDEKLTDVLKKRKKQNTLQQLLTKEDFSNLKKISTSWKTNLLVLKPIEVLITLRREFQVLKCKTVKDTDKWDHFDNYLIDIARRYNKSIVGLETDSLQLTILDDIEKSWSRDTLSQEISFWISKLTNPQNGDNDECLESQQYQRFEIDYEFEEECTDDILITERNKKWMLQLSPLLSNKNCFIAVGLLHLKHKCGLLESFKKNGFKVEPIIL